MTALGIVIPAAAFALSVLGNRKLTPSASARAQRIANITVAIFLFCIFIYFPPYCLQQQSNLLFPNISGRRESHIRLILFIICAAALSTIS
ncbi:MAG: hypothetical protein K2H30_05510, partial [Clostridia bacterium]|nr:hypothetical protein [Clostridia bacterium]